MSHHQQPPRLKITKVIAVFAFVASFEAFIGIEGHDTLGDEHRSETSSEQFFNFIDKDRDGKLGQSELSQFLIAHIGGSTLDEVAEAKKEAEAIRVRLDQNKDDELDSKDIFRYWKSLESLLTVNEVAEWVVHSVQLPPEIGE
jgi:Ca2+-binding EF-hand superfamily protein